MTAARTLGRVHGDISVVRQCLLARAVGGIEGDADTAASF